MRPAAAAAADSLLEEAYAVVPPQCPGVPISRTFPPAAASSLVKRLDRDGERGPSPGSPTAGTAAGPRGCRARQRRRVCGAKSGGVRPRGLL